MFSTALHSRQPWSKILSSLIDLRMTGSSTLTTTDLMLPGGISVLLITYKDDTSTVIERVNRAIQSEEGEDVTVVIFLGNGVWDFQLLLDSTFVEPVYLIPLSTPQDLSTVLKRLAEDFKTTTAAKAVSEAKAQVNWTPARLLPLVATTGTHLSPHVNGGGMAATLVLHSLFPSLPALAHGANMQSLEVLEDSEARSVVDFLDIEYVFGG